MVVRKWVGRGEVTESWPTKGQEKSKTKQKGEKICAVFLGFLFEHVSNLLRFADIVLVLESGIPALWNQRIIHMSFPLSTSMRLD